MSYQRADAILARKWARIGADACQIHWNTPLCAADHRCARHSSMAALTMLLVYTRRVHTQLQDGHAEPQCGWERVFQAASGGW